MQILVPKTLQNSFQFLELLDFVGFQESVVNYELDSDQSKPVF